MSNELEELEMDEVMKVLADYAKVCYNAGCKDTIIGVAIGAGLVLAGYIALTFMRKTRFVNRRMN